MRGRSGRVVVLSIVVAVIAMMVAYSASTSERRQVQRAVTAYDVALAESLRANDETVLEAVALPREIGRVRNYLVLLEATATRIDAELLELDVRTVESSDSTVTATVFERWREVERDTRTGLARSEEIERSQLIEYTLAPEDGVLKVYMSRILDEDAR